MVFNPQLPQDIGSWVRKDSVYTHSRYSSGALALQCVTDAASHQEHQLGVFGREGGTFQSVIPSQAVPCPHGLHSILTALTHESLSLVLSPKVRCLFGCDFKNGPMAPRAPLFSFLRWMR